MCLLFKIIMIFFMILLAPLFFAKGCTYLFYFSTFMYCLLVYLVQRLISDLLLFLNRVGEVNREINEFWEKLQVAEIVASNLVQSHMGAYFLGPNALCITVTISSPQLLLHFVTIFFLNFKP